MTRIRNTGHVCIKLLIMRPFCMYVSMVLLNVEHFLAHRGSPAAVCVPCKLYLVLLLVSFRFWVLLVNVLLIVVLTVEVPYRTS